MALGRSQARLLKIGLASFSLPALVFLSVPAAVLSRNLEETVLHPDDTLVFVYCFAVATAFVFAVTALWRGGERLIFILTASLILNVIVWNVLSERVWPHGARLFLTLAVESTALLVSLAVLRRIPTEMLARALCVYSGLIVPLSLWEMRSLEARSVPMGGRPASAEQGAPEKRGEVRRGGGNVYHVILDEFSSRYLNGVLSSGRKVNWDGYTFFRHASSEYGRTDYSLRSVFQGTVYRPGDSRWFREPFDTGLLRRLNEGGVAVTMYPFYEHYCVDFAQACRSTVGYYNSLFSGATVQLAADLTFLNLLPVSVRGPLIRRRERPMATWDYGFSLTSTVLDYLGTSRWLVWAEQGLQARKSAPEWMRQRNAFTMDTLEQFVAEEPMREPAGQYVFVHLIMPHGPYLRDSTCRYVGPRELSPEAVDAQYECALATIDRINQTLSRLQRYDESLIIIHSDHGTPRAADCARWDGEFPYDSTVAWVNVDETPPEVVPPQQLDCSSGVLFLLKPPHARAFRTSDLPVQLVDVAPTIAEFSSLSPSPEWEGASLLSEPEELHRRPKRYYGTRTNNIKNLDYFSEFVGDGDGWRFSRRIVPAPADYR